MPTRDDAFYIGYHPRAPRSVARAAGLCAGVLLTLGAGAAAVIVSSQRPLPASTWDAQVVELTGVLQARPYPVLHVPSDGGGAARGLILVAFGKCGAQALGDYCGPAWAGEPSGLVDAPGRARLLALDGRTVTARGTILRRGSGEAMELVSGEGALRAGAGPALDMPPEEELGVRSIVGEVVDPKCAFGAMRPGEGAVHRACAARCISGGIPPALLVRGPAGEELYLLASAEGGMANERFARLAGATVRVGGRVVRRGGVLTIFAEPASLGRAPGRYDGAVSGS